MDLQQLLYTLFLALQLYALAYHFHHPTTGSAAPIRQKLVILLSLLLGGLTAPHILLPSTASSSSPFSSSSFSAPSGRGRAFLPWLLGPSSSRSGFGTNTSRAGSGLASLASGLAPLASTLSTPLLLSATLLFLWTALTTRPGRLGVIYADVTPRYVVKRGPYKWVRHPTYVSYALGWVGAVLAMVATGGGERISKGVLGAAVGVLAGLCWLYGDAAGLEEGQFEGGRKGRGSAREGGKGEGEKQGEGAKGSEGEGEGVAREYREYKRETGKWVPGRA